MAESVAVERRVEKEQDDSPVDADPGAQARPGEAETAEDAQGRLEPLVTGLFKVSLAAAVLTMVFRVYNLFVMPTLWDDAYIFQRYAEHLLAGEGLSWHPGGEPVYGLTSLLFVVPSALFRAIVSNPGLAALLASTVCGVVFVGMTLWLLLRHVDGPAEVRAGAALLVFVCMAWSTTADHCASGMDTTFALAYLAGYLVAAHRFETKATRGSAALLAVLGGLAFWVRPELVAFTLAIPAACLWFHRDEERKLAWLALGGTAIVLALVLMSNRLYFGSALPLPFYAKSTGIYQGAMRRAYRGVSSQHLVEFVGFYWPLFTILGLELTVRFKRFWREATALDKGAVVALLTCLLYYWLVALPIMAMAERFYQPAVVPLGYLAARTLVRWSRDLAPQLRVSRDGWMLAAVLGMLLFGGLLMPRLVEQGKAFAWNAARRRPHFDLFKHAVSKGGPLTYWFEIDEFSRLPDDLVMATTEVGYLTALNPNKKIIDMAGLNEPVFAFEPMNAELLLGEMRPDLVYMPHEDYRAMTQDILGSPIFKKHYVHFDKKKTRTNKFGIAIRKDSPHFDAMMKIVRRAGIRRMPRPVAR